MTTFLAIAAFHVLALMSPGPDFIVVTRNSLRYGRVAGTYTGFGMAVGVMVHVGYCLLGIGLLISQSIVIFNTLKYVGAAYLVCLGIASFLSSGPSNLQAELSGPKSAKPLDKMKAFKMGFLCNILNPKATLAFLSIFTVMMTPRTPLGIQLSIAGFMFISTALWFWFVASMMSHPRVQKVFASGRETFDKTIGIALVSLGLKLVNASN